MSKSRSCQVSVAAHGDQDLPGDAQGKCITWCTEVNDTTTIDKVCTDWYMSKTNASAELDWLGDVGALEGLIPQWQLITDGHPKQLYKDQTTFGTLFAAHAPPEGTAVLRFVGQLKHTNPSEPNPNSKIDLWYQDPTSEFWDPAADRWIDLNKLLKSGETARFQPKGKCGGT